MKRRVVIFDLGGVVADSPVVAIQKFAAAQRLNDLNPFLGQSVAWDDFMRGRLAPTAFPAAAFEESQKINFADGVSLGRL